MRAGADGDTLFILTSLLHEETHIFNFSFLNDTPQGWWTGEFSCIYFQQRALWQGQQKQTKQQIQNLLPNGPGCNLAEISARRKQAFDEALSVFYFIEEQYGREKFIELRKALLLESQKTNGRSLSNSVFEQVLGENLRRLETQWLKFYGWKSLSTTKETRPADTRLKTKISYSVDKASVQNVVKDMAERAGLKYDWEKSQSNADQLCRRWVRNVQLNNKPLDEALVEILDPIGLTYRFQENAIVLYRK
jgi:phenylpropionate dioxygenase-like ring-hydroxylating dioxygenase large terminal subunit